MNGNDIVIVSTTRTAIGKFGGQFATTSAIELGTTVAKAAIQKANLSPEQIDTVIFGNVLQAGLGQNPARQVGLGAGLNHASTAVTVNEVCGSGLKAIISAAQDIRLGDAKIVLAGGMENMSLAPHLLQQRFAPKNGPVTLVDSLFNDGLTDAYSQDAMGITAENIVEKYGFTREEQDAFAVASQQKAAKAQEEGRFDNEITPVAVFNRKTKSDDLKATDEFIRPNTTLCIAVPAWQNREGRFTHLPLIKNLKKLGYQQIINKNLLYHREDQVVAREILVLKPAYITKTA